MLLLLITQMKSTSYGFDSNIIVVLVWEFTNKDGVDLVKVLIKEEVSIHRSHPGSAASECMDINK